MRRILIILAITSMFSCTNNIFFMADKDLENGWDIDSLVEFYFLVSDTTNTFYSEIKLRHSNLYAYRNLFVFIHMTNPEGVRTTDTVECILAEKTGKWKGKHIGDILEFSQVYKDVSVFEISGEYKIEIEQAMRYHDLAGIQRLEEIKSVGVEISQNRD